MSGENDRADHEQRFSVDERHRVVQKPVRLAGGEHGHDVRMMQTRCELNFPPETFGAHDTAELRRQHLDDDGASQRILARYVHARHPAASELALDRVGRSERRLKLVAQLGAHGGARSQFGLVQRSARLRARRVRGLLRVSEAVVA
jgi:hypothetical protein